jgi:hypothetical protein
MKRRSFLRNVISASVLSLGGVSAFQYYQQSQLKPVEEDDFSYEFLTEQDRILLEVLIPVFVSGLSLNKQVPLTTVTQNIEAAIVRLPRRTQVELRELFELLASIFGRLMLANVWLNWQSASPESIDKFLGDWRDSSIDLLQTAYKGLHKLIIGSVYAESNIWQQIGYSGPPVISFSQV